jgi:acetyl esterase/lipase
MRATKYKEEKAMPLSKEIQDFVRSHGNTWSLDVNAVCERFFDDQHAKTVAKAEGVTPAKGLKYGPHDRQRLDVYSPTTTTDLQQNAPVPVVVYFHGGGFRAGENDISPHMHGNIGRSREILKKKGNFLYSS